jgi:hypothetical protein
MHWQSFSSDLPIARALRSEADKFPARIIGISTFSRAVNDDRRLNVWNTNPLKQ